MNVLGFAHTSYTVSDLDRALGFWSDLLGCPILFKRDVRQRYFAEIVGLPNCVVRSAYLRIPGSEHLIELFEYTFPRGAPADVRNNNPGSSHVALVVDDLAEFYDKLTGAGVQFRSPPVEIDEGPNRGAWAAYALDPDGITVELFQPAEK